MNQTSSLTRIYREETSKHCVYEWWYNGCASMMDLLHTFCSETAFCVKGHKYHMRKKKQKNKNAEHLPATSKLPLCLQCPTFCPVPMQVLSSRWPPGLCRITRCPSSMLSSGLFTVNPDTSSRMSSVEEKKGQSSPGRYCVSVKKNK